MCILMANDIRWDEKGYLRFNADRRWSRRAVLGHSEQCLEWLEWPYYERLECHIFNRQVTRMTERKAWTPKEDAALKELYEKRGVKKWAQISRLLEKQYEIPNRNGKQCRQRYHNHLDSSIRHDKWTPSEENQLLQLHNSLGNHWAEIAKLLQGRSENCVKNQFYCILRRGLRKINRIIRERLKRFKELEITILYKVVENCEHAHNAQNATSLEIKRELAFFGMTDLDSKQIELPRIKTIIEKVKSFDRLKQKKKSKGADRVDEERSDSIESEEYRDDCPLGQIVLRRGSIYSFKLENEEKQEVDNCEQKTIANTTASHSQMLRRFSLQSLESLSPRLQMRESRCSDFFGMETVNMEGFGDYGRNSPQAAIRCDSPYFDQFRSAASNFSSLYNADQQ